MIEELHTEIYNTVDSLGLFSQGFYEQPKAITEEKLPAFAVYYSGHDNELTTSNANKRSFRFVVELIYDKEDVATTQTVTSGIVQSTIDALESRANITLSGHARYTEPTTCERVEDYEISGKHYLAYRITLPVVTVYTLS